MQWMTRRGLWLVTCAVALAGSGQARPAAAQCTAPPAATHLAAGETHLAAGRYRDAISEFNRAILAAPECDRAKQGIIEANRALLQRRGGTATLESEIGRHISRGGAAFDAGRYEQAIAEWEAALALAPDNRVAAALIASAREAQVDLLIEDGSRLFAGGDTAGALAAWERAQALDAFNPTIAELLDEGRHQASRDTEVHLAKARDSSIRRMRTEILRSSLLPYEDMTGGGVRYRDISERPTGVLLEKDKTRGAIKAELRNPVSLDFEDTDLRAVLRFLSEVTGINFLVDQDVFEELGEIDPDDEEAEPQIKVTIFVNELPLESALKGMLRQHGLDFSVERDFLYISTPDVLSATSFEQLEVRYYRLRDTARISLPKLSAEPGELEEAVGEDVETASVLEGDLIERLEEVTDDEVLDGPTAPINLSVARLLSLLRNFVPTVVETASQAGRQQQQIAARAQDTVVGGWSRFTEQTRVIEAEAVPRERQWDSANRLVLSKIDYDALTHTLIAKNTASNLSMIEEMLDHLDQPTRQVLIESRFMRVSMNDVQRVDTDLSLIGLGGNSSFEGAIAAAGSSLSTVGTGLGLGGLFTAGSTFLGGQGGSGKALRLRFSASDGEVAQAAVELLTQLDNTEVVSAPRITTLSGKPAVIQDIQTETFLTDVEVETEVVQPPPGSSAAPVVVSDPDFSFTAVTTGITMTVTPLVLDDDTIRLVLLPDVSSLGDGGTFQLPFQAFQADGSSVTNFISISLIEVLRQSLFTNVTVTDGDTLVLGGLVRNEVTFQEKSVPFFRDLPLLGNFFRSTGESTKRSQLLIFITCNVLSPNGFAYVRLK